MNKIQNSTLRSVSRFLKILTDSDVVTVQEMNYINLNLKHLREKDTFAPVVANRLIDRKELCSILSLSVSNLKRLEKSGEIDIPILRISSTLRYRLYDVHQFIESNND